MTDFDQAIPSSVPLKILLADTNWWANSARLAIGLAEVGCEVSAICRTPNHPLLKTRAVHRVFPYEAFSPVSGLRAAIEQAEPDLVVPACDRSVVHLHELYADAQVRGVDGQKMRGLIERSLGAPASYSVVSSRYMLLSIAEASGVRIPRTRLVTRQAALDEWRRKESFPWVLKADRTWGGNGVRIVHSEDEAEQSLQQLAQMSRFSRAIKRLIINRDPFWLRDWRVGSARGIIAQSYVDGKPSNCTTVCWKGKVLAAIAVQVVRSEGPSGPASIVRIVEGGEMLDAARRIAAKLNLSGFAGFDFVEETGTGKAYLIEMNPRIAPPCHLRLRHGRDLPGSLWAQLAERPAPEPLREPGTDLVAYFPMAVKNDIPAGCYRDVPIGEPDLVAEMLNPFPDRTFFFRFAQFITQAPGSSDISEVSHGEASGKPLSIGDERALESEKDQPV